MNATLREVSSWHLLLKIHKITENQAPNFASLLFKGQVTKLIVNLLKYKQNTKILVDVKFGKDLWTSFVLDSLTSMIECRQSSNTE